MPNLIELPKNKNKFQVTNKTETVAEVLLYGEIGEAWYDSASVSAKQFAEAMKELPSSTKEIHLRVNSPGGSVFDGMSIFEHIKSQRSKHGRKVIAYVDGYAASIASIIIQAADEIIIGDGGFVMVHKPLVGVWGNAIELERMINLLDKIEEQMITIYSKKMDASRAEIANILAEETWYTSDEAIEVGLADKKFEAKETLQLVASMGDYKWMKNKPAMKSQSDLVRAKLREFNNKAESFLKK